MNTIPPLTAQLSDLETFKCVRRILGQFYSAIKTTEGKLRFLFVTGITKFSQTSIFSELNITDDFSFASEYSALLGYEEDEIDRYFSAQNLVARCCIAELKKLDFGCATCNPG